MARPWVRAVAMLAVPAFSASCANGGEPISSTATTVPATASTSASPSSSVPAGENILVGDHQTVGIELASPDWLAADDTSVYVKLDSGSSVRIDPETGAVGGSVEIAGEGGLAGSGCNGIGAGFDSVWTCHGAEVVRIGLDPFTEVSRIGAQKSAAQAHLATGFGRVWVLQGDGSSLAGIDPQSEQVGEPIPLPVRGTDLAVGEAAVWVVSAIDDAVLAVDPADGSVVHRIDTLVAPSAVSVADGLVWIGARGGVHGVDESTGTIVSTAEGGPGAEGAIAADEAGVWVRRGNDVRHVDRATGTDTDTFPLPLEGPSPGDMVVAFGALWTTASEDATLYRIALDAAAG